MAVFLGKTLSKLMYKRGITVQSKFIQKTIE